MEDLTKGDQLERQLHNWFVDFGRIFGVEQPPAPETLGTILELIEVNNQMADVIAGPDYQRILKEEQELAGDVIIGQTRCVDGRCMRLFPLGIIVRSYEEPGGFIGVRERDGRLMPQSLILATALKMTAGADKDLLQLAEAHTSLNTGHKCGAAAAIQKDPDDERIRQDEDPASGSLRLISQTTVEAITQNYNEVRIEKGISPLARVCLPILFDTDTYGYILRYGEEGQLPTTELSKRFKENIEMTVGSMVGEYGSMRDKFTNPDHYLDLAKGQLAVTKYLLQGNPHFSAEVSNFIESYYPDLTERQKKGLRFVLAKTVAFQYLTGLADEADNMHPNHPHSDHAEEFLTISLKGKLFGLRHPGKQGFGTSPSDKSAGVKALKMELGLRGADKTPHIVFVVNPVGEGQLSTTNSTGLLDLEDTEGVQREEAELADFVRRITDDRDIKRMIKHGEVILVPGYIAESSRKLLRIADLSSYL